jgi:beta-mannosidase
VVDSTGAPKAAWHALRRAFRPVQVTLTDEGVNGLAVHLINETERALPAVLVLQCLREGELPVARTEREVTLPPRSALEISSAELLPAFFDVTYAYRFGPPAHDATVASLHAADGALLADAFHFPLGRGAAREDLGLTAEAHEADGAWTLRLRTRRLAQSVHVEDDHFRAENEWFHLPPGADRLVRLLPRDDSGAAPDGEVHALNGRMPVRFRGPS